MEDKTINPTDEVLAPLLNRLNVVEKLQCEKLFRESFYLERYDGMITSLAKSIESLSSAFEKEMAKNQMAMYEHIGRVRELCESFRGRIVKLENQIKSMKKATKKKCGPRK